MKRAWFAGGVLFCLLLAALALAACSEPAPTEVLATPTPSPAQNAERYLDTVGNQRDFAAAEKYVCVLRQTYTREVIDQLIANEERTGVKVSFTEIACLSGGADVKCSYKILKAFPDGLSTVERMLVIFVIDENGRVCGAQPIN